MKPLALAVLLLTPAALAQTGDPVTTVEPGLPVTLADFDSPMPADSAVTTATLAALAPADLTEAERAVLDRLGGGGLHVVHFWAPWCGNSIAELRDGWYQLVEGHPDVGFTFVTIWNDGESAREEMVRYGLSERVAEVVQPDLGPSDDKENRRRRFLGLPVTWIPTTWVVRENGELAYAFNYGEMGMDELARAVGAARADWPH